MQIFIYVSGFTLLSVKLPHRTPVSPSWCWNHYQNLFDSTGRAKIFLLGSLDVCIFDDVFISLTYKGKWYYSHPFEGKTLIFFFCQSILFFHVVLIKAIPNFVDFHYICRVLKLTFTLLQLVSNYQSTPLGIFSAAVYPLYLSPEVSQNARAFWSIIPPGSFFCSLLSATSLSISSKHVFPSSLRFWSPSTQLLSARRKKSLSISC